MYNLEDFEPYALRNHLGTEPVLAWSRKNGYHFLSMTERFSAMADGENFTIVGVMKGEKHAK